MSAAAAPLPAPRERRLSARDGLRLAALDWPGDPARTPLLCLPGLLRTGLDFEGVAARQAGRRRVVALDYAGHGESGRADDPKARYAPRRAVGDVLDACAALGVRHAAVVGTSFGGLLAIFLAVFRPTLVRAAVLNDIGTRVETRGLDTVRAVVGTDPALAHLDEAVAYIERAMPGQPLPPDAAGRRRYAERTFRRGEDGRWHPRWDTRLAAALDGDGAAGGGGGGADFRTAFAGLGPVPTLLVHGAESDILSAATVAEMRAAKPDLEVLTAPGLGHAPTLDEPGVAPALDAFLARAVP